ncbi:Hypothetical protein FKW44_015141 [Caligus rogercresseyi]|uniref:Secreted protein n=1 Tax=Caligus rogercresseyi TaxID=217165 RepID=A0A7T8H077_CALRO|nr:Hypothetical protein FKW44_015141 [Caligus rogercresseyi]
MLALTLAALAMMSTFKLSERVESNFAPSNSNSLEGETVEGPTFTSTLFLLSLLSLPPARSSWVFVWLKESLFLAAKSTNLAEVKAIRSLVSGLE